jgi:MFS family permease
MASTREAERLDPELRRLIGILILGAIAALLDTTVVTIAVDTLSRELDASVAMIQWVNTGYLLALGMVVPLSAWSVGRFGAKQMWLFALTLFLVGSVLPAGRTWAGSWLPSASRRWWCRSSVRSSAG